MTNVAEKVIDYICSGLVSVRIDWDRFRENEFKIIGFENQFEFIYTIYILELYVIVSAVFSKIDDESSRTLSNTYYRLESNENKAEFQKTVKQMCMDIHNSELKSQGLIDFI